MEKFMNISEELQELLNKSKELGWSYSVYIAPTQNNRTFVEMIKYSPAGEDFSMIVDFNADNQAETFLRDLRECVYNFDPDEHVEMWLPQRGKGDCPGSIRELLDDADSIKKMCEELFAVLERVGTAELTDEQSE